MKTRKKLTLSLLGLTGVLGCGSEAGAPAGAWASAATLEAPAALVGDTVPDQYIVVLRDGVSTQATAAVEGLVQAGAGQILRRYDRALHGLAARMPRAAAELLAKDPRVALVEPDRVVGLTETQRSAPWGLDRIDRRDLPLDGNYESSAAGSGVDVYVIDSGIRASHSEFGGRVQAGHAAVNDGRGTDDCNGHGTHVAGTIGGATYGVAKGVSLIPVRVFGCAGTTATSTVIAAVDWVTGHHQPGRPAIANMSLSGGPSDAMDAAVRRSTADGVTYVVAAGNNNADACGASPARVAEAITVGASTQTDARAGFSNHGACVDLFAPGAGILSAGIADDRATATMSGTSMAAPHVAGAAALYLSPGAPLPPDEVQMRVVLRATNEKLSDLPSGTPNRLLHTWAGVLFNQLAEKCIDVDGAPGTANGARLQLFDCEVNSPGGTDQRWEMTRDGYLRNLRSGKCLDVDGAPGTQNGARLQLWDCELGSPGTTDQRWEMTSDGHLRNLRSGKCVDVEGAPGLADRARLQLWDCEPAGGSPRTDQLWSRF